MQVSIKPSKLHGSIYAPPSKSMAHRLLICAGLSKGESRISGLSFSDDILATIDSLRELGAMVVIEGDTALITGFKPFNITKPKALNCRECGSTLRFMIPICMLSDEKITLKGSKTLMSRPLGIYENIAVNQGLEFSLDNDILSLRGTLKSGSYSLDGSVSSQFISGLMFALPNLKEDSSIELIEPVESRPYIEMTLNALKTFGINIEAKGDNVYYIKGGQEFKAASCRVEGDYSNAAFLEGFNLLDGSVDVKGLRSDSLQGDKVYLKLFDDIKNNNYPIDISDCPDLGPVLFALSAYMGGGEFTGTRRLKFKESDRASAMAEELKKFGVSLKIDDNSVTILNGIKNAPQEILYGHNDHRIVMSLSLLLTRYGGTIKGAEAVKKSYPDFFQKIRTLGAEMIIDGMDK